MYLNNLANLSKDCLTRVMHLQCRQIPKILLLITIVIILLVLHLWQYAGMSSSGSLQSPDAQKVNMPDSFKRHGIYSFNKIIVKPDTVREKLLFLVLISTTAGNRKNRDRREAIRNTWGNCQSNMLQRTLRSELLTHSRGKESESLKDYYKCRVMFFVGETGNKSIDTAVKEEASIYKDIIVVDVKEHYRNITWKLRSAMQFVSNFDLKYLIKTDDDVYVNLPRLTKYIATGLGFSTIIYGGTTYTGVVVRDPLHRHHVKKSDYGEQYYPLYCKGSMVVLSGNLLPSVVKAFAHIKPFNIDDAYLGITINKLGISPHRLERIVQFQHLLVFLDYLHLCDFSWLVGVGDGLDYTQIHSVHEAMIQGESLPNWMCFHSNLYPIFCVLFIISFLFAFFKARDS